jgi:hypothetical protein
MLLARLFRQKEGHSSLGRWFFWASIILSQIAGVTIGRWQIARFFSSGNFSHVHPFLSPLLFQVLAAMFAFWVMYCLLALNVVGFVEEWTGMKIVKPGMGWGFLFTMVIPLVLCGVGFLIILFLSGTPVSV